MKFLHKIKFKYKILYFACAILSSTYFSKSLHNKAYATKIYSEESNSANLTNEKSQDENISDKKDKLKKKSKSEDEDISDKKDKLKKKNKSEDEDISDKKDKLKDISDKKDKLKKKSKSEDEDISDEKDKPKKKSKSEDEDISDKKDKPKKKSKSEDESWQFKKGKNSEIFKDVYEPSLKKIKENFLTTKQLFKKLRDNELSVKEAMNFYFNMSEEKISALLGNDRYTINTGSDLTNKNNAKILLNEERIKKDKKMSEKTKRELKEQNKILKSEIKYFDEVYKLIQKYEVKYILEDKIKKILPEDPEKLKKVAFINPGHGFEDSGAIYNFKGEKIKECDINAKVSKKIIEKLLHNNFQIYVVCNLKYSDIDLNELQNNKNLHIIFEGRPPIIGDIKKIRVADAYAVCMQTLIREMQKKTKKAKVNCLCLHHDYNPDSKLFGSVVFYEITEKTSKQVVENSKIFAEILFKNLQVPHKQLLKKAKKNGAKLDKSNDISKIKIEDWAMCHLGGEDEKRVKKFVNHALVLLEEEYLSNPYILKTFLDDETQEAFAKAIAMSFCEYFDTKYEDVKCKPAKIKKSQNDAKNSKSRKNKKTLITN